MYTLRPYQLEKLNFYNPPGKEPVAAVLDGDEMGLGKTVTAVARERRLRQLPRRKDEKGKRVSLYVVPAGSMVDSWVEHLEEHLPELSVMKMDPKNRKAFVVDLFKGGHHIYVMHWEALRLEPKLATVQWLHVAADEVHRAANRKAQQTQALKRLPTFYKTAMSGTWTFDKPDQAWSILHWLYPKRFSSYHRFFNRYVDYIVEYADGRQYKKMTGVRNAEELHQIIEPFYMRRLKKDVLQDLPDKFYTTLWVDLYPEQRRAYDEMRKKFLAWVGEQQDQPVAAPVVISQLIRLQQFATAYARLEQQKDGSLKLVMSEPSSKLDALEEILNEAGDAQVVVFSQSKQLINLAAKRLQARYPERTGVLTGDTPQTDRFGLVERFQRGHDRIFLGTIQAGGVGITLTAASIVVFLDRAWTPAINVQAEDRLHRIGQKNAVQVIDIMAKHTVDLGRWQRLEQKWVWIQTMLGDNPQPKILIGPDGQPLLKVA